MVSVAHGGMHDESMPAQHACGENKAAAKTVSHHPAFAWVLTDCLYDACSNFALAAFSSQPGLPPVIMLSDGRQVSFWAASIAAELRCDASTGTSVICCLTHGAAASKLTCSPWHH